jgi:hypothetical protein
MRIALDGRIRDDMKNFVAIASVAVILFGASCGWSQTITVGLYSDPEGTECEWNLAADPVVELYVIITSSEPACLTGVQLAVPIPDCARGKLFWMNDDSPFPVTLGDSQSGVAIGFGSYYFTPITVLKMTYIIGSQDLDYCDLQVFPVTNGPPGEALVSDCSFNAVTARGHGVGLSYCVGQMPPPYNLSPVDGAADVPLNPVLSWESWMPDVCGPTVLGCYPTHQVFFGTTPNPPRVLYDHGGFSWQPGTLQPGTTYYWRVVHRTWTGSQPGSSPEMSFTTVGSVAAQGRSWGSIKSLYGERTNDK